MSNVRVHITVSADGYVAGPNQSEENPLGEGGESLHEWVVALRSLARAPRPGRRRGEREQRRPGGGAGECRGRDHGRGSSAAARAMGRRAVAGLVGEHPPFHMPVFVVTHHEREPLTLSDTTFTFVTDGIESALEQAREAAGGKDVTSAAGPTSSIST